MIRSILVDDETLALKNLDHVLGRFDDVEVEAVLSNPLEALVKIGELKPDVVFLDIEMPGTNGFTIAEEILKISPKILVVFVTAYDEHAVKAFEVNALDYILKPVTYERISRTVEKIKESRRIRQSRGTYQKCLRNASRMLKLKFDKVIAWQNDMMYLINIHEILYLTIKDGAVLVITEEDTYKTRGTLNNWEERLAFSGFYRCHKSFLININKVAVISPMFKNTLSIKLHNCKAEIPVSRRYAVRLKQILNI